LHAIWVFITDCGDSAVTVPLALLTLIFLVARGERRVAFGWVVAIGGCAGAIAALKLGFGACGQRVPFGDIVSPSGHTAMSAAIYGSLALLVGAQLSPLARRLAYGAAAAGILGIAVSRVALHDHDAAEIAVGLIVGAGAVAIFRAMLGRTPAPALPLGWFLLSGAALVAVMHGTRWMIEPVVHRLAGILRLGLPGCH
jgi:hypothetical protein